jgi:oxygen-dependent protoporphyrinogen oxidase
VRARPSIVIIGGGISGLAAAWEFSQLTTSGLDARVEVLEASAECGGALRSREFAGRMVDLGPDGYLARRPEATHLVAELGWADHLEAIGASGAWIYLGGKLRPLPSNLVLGVPTTRRSLRDMGGLSRTALWAAWRDEHLPRRLEVGEDATIGQIARTKLGDEIASRLVEPLIGGIQAGRIDELSARSVFPALLTAARSGGSLMKALGSQGPASPGPASATVAGPAFYTLDSSVGSLPSELAGRLRERGVVVHTGAGVVAMRRTVGGPYPWEIDTASTTTAASAVVVATPPHPAGRLLGAFSPDLEVLSQMRTASAAMVTFSVPVATTTLPATGTGILVPRLSTTSSGDPMLTTAVTLLDRKWPHLADGVSHLVRVHVGRIDDRRHAELSDEALVARVTKELQTLLGSWPDPLATMVARHPDGLPQYEVGHQDLVERARAAAAPLSVALAGNAYDGVGIPASIGSGRRAAREAVEMLGS